MRERRIFSGRRGKRQRRSISTKKSLTSCTGPPQRFEEVFNLEGRRDVPLLRDHGPRAQEVVEGLLAPDVRVEYVGGAGPRTVLGVRGGDKREELLQRDRGAAEERRPCPGFGARRSKELDSAERVFDAPAEATLEAGSLQIRVQLGQVKTLGVPHKHGRERRHHPG